MKGDTRVQLVNLVKLGRTGEKEYFLQFRETLLGKDQDTIQVQTQIVVAAAV